ncbi:MAG: 1-acyl-sn-glycerol-3-phosphate acyltransferase [Patescibacteria group bacterium]
MSVPIENRQEFFAVENYKTALAHTEAHWQDPEQAAKLHARLSMVLKPRVHFAPGIEDRMTQEVANGAICAIAFNHASAFDPVQIAAMASQNPSFHPLIGKTMIGAKVGLFTSSVTGPIVPDLGALPIWRKKDVESKSDSAEERERLTGLRKLANQAVLATEIHGMNTGHHLAKHVEGTRNKKNPKMLLPVREGFGRVVAGVDPEVDILMMTGAFYYITAKA